MTGATPGPWFEHGYSVYAPTPQDVPAGFRGFNEPEIPGGYLIAESIPHDATRRLIACAPDLLAALAGDDPETPEQISPLSWLRSMVDACDTAEAVEALGGDDPAAWRDMVREVRALLDRGRAAVAKARAGGAE